VRRPFRELRETPFWGRGQSEMRSNFANVVTEPFETFQEKETLFRVKR
jgi:hypothetical protein